MESKIVVKDKKKLTGKSNGICYFHGDNFSRIVQIPFLKKF